ncbi:hypothetical protein SprV_0100383500 [Sparganum proliferum]
MPSPFPPPTAIVRNDSWCRLHQQRLSATPEFPYVIKGPVYMYYEISNFYQNHRRFARSVSVEQLRGVMPSKESLKKCHPLLSSKNESQEYIYMPCGLLPNSVFNDSFLLKFIESPSSMHSVPLSSSSIAWKSDVEKMYGTVPSNGWTGTIKPPNWPKPAYERAAGAFKTDQELMVWNRIAPFSTFRKLHRVLDTRPGIFASGFPAGKYILQITSNFPVAAFGGTKAVIFAQVNCLEILRVDRPRRTPPDLMHKQPNNPTAASRPSLLKPPLRPRQHPSPPPLFRIPVPLRRRSLSPSPLPQPPRRRCSPPFKLPQPIKTLPTASKPPPSNNENASSDVD